MLWDDMNRAVSEAKTTISRADSMIKQMGYIMRGKLRSGGVSEYVLEDFKKELRNFDMRTHCWKDD